MLNYTATIAFRAAGNGARCTMHSIVRTTHTTCPYSTATTALKANLRPMSIAASSLRRYTLASTRQASPAPVLARVVRQSGARRSNSTLAPSSQKASTTINTAAAPGSQKLDWNTFFTLRKTRRRWQLLFSVTMFGVGGAAGAVFLASGLADPVVTQIPLDPFFTLGFMTMGFAALGWLAGPSLGSAVFYTMNRKFQNQMTVKETEFFARVKKNRVDPSASSASNPVPDFYGEKIQSVAGYRQWLKDQRAFNKKRTSFV